MSNSPPTSTPSSPNATTTASTISPDGTNVASTLKIDHSTDDKAIKSIFIEDTWSTYLFNCESPSYNEESLANLDDESKYDELMNLKLPTFHDITSPFSTCVVTSGTADESINAFPPKDCKLLLTAYATNQGYHNFVSRLDAMSVDEMRLELIKAKKNLIYRPQTNSTSSAKKPKHFSTPFVLTH